MSGLNDYMDEYYEKYLYKRFDLHDSVALYYDIERNRFISCEFGQVIYNPYLYVTPSQVLLFKTKKENMTFMDVTSSFIVELIYPDYNYSKFS